MSGLTEQDARALTYLATRLRTETHGARKWDDAGTYAAIAKLVGHNLAIAVEQVTRHAADPEAKTPAAIHRPFLPEPPPRSTALPPRRHEECPKHPGEYAHACRSCAADRIASDGCGAENFSSMPGEWNAEKVRAYLRRRAKERDGASS